MEHTTYYDDSIVLKEDEATGSVTIYVETTGDDNTGDGTSGKPYATIERAFKDVPIRALHSRIIQLGVGTFDYPEDTSITYYKTGHYIQGMVSITAPLEISNIGVSDRDNGLQLQVAPSPGWVADELVGRHIKFSSGALNNQYGVIYKNTVDTIWVTCAPLTWATPAVTDTFYILTLETTVNNDVTSPDKIGMHLAFLVFQDLNITGGYHGTSYSTVAFVRCNLQIEQLAAANNATVVPMTCYIKQTDVIPAANVLVVGEHAFMRVINGCVVDGATTGDVNVGTGGSITFRGETVFKELSSNGIEMRSGSNFCGADADDKATVRFFDSAAGIVVGSYDSNVNIAMPYVGGNITGNYAVNLQASNSTAAFTGGTVTTALGTNTGTVNGSNESNYSYKNGSKITGTGNDADNVIAADATTVDVSYSMNKANVYKTSANTGATAITNFTNGSEGQIVRLRGGSNTNSTTVADGGSFSLAGAAGFTASLDAILESYLSGSVWEELNRRAP